MGQLKVWAAAAMGLALCACQHTRPAPIADNCSIPARRMIVGENHTRGASIETTARPGERTLQDDVVDILKGRRPPSGLPGVAGAPSQPIARTGRPELLVLSGGGQHGAFGGGLFVGLYQAEHGQAGALPPGRRDTPARVPTYDIVTGISTGSLLSTTIFLANNRVPGDRMYPDDQGERLFTPGRSNIEDMGVALSISSEKALLTHGGNPIVDALRKGAAGDLAPLRQRLLGFITAETLRIIREEAAKGRKLYVGVANVDDGGGYALDLTELSSRIADKIPADTPAQDNARAETLRKCYVDALIASSSVPIGALPVTLDITTNGGVSVERGLYVDGGARFGVFLNQVAPAVRDDPDIGPVNVTLIVNGVLYTKPWIDTPGRPDPETDKWTAVSVGLRTVKLLENQVYRYSVDSVETFPLKGGDLRMAFIANEGLGRLPGPPLEHVMQGKTCTEWRKVDKAREKPFEFDARYMACLLDYGRTRAREDPWNLYVKNGVRQPPAAAR